MTPTYYLHNSKLYGPLDRMPPDPMQYFDYKPDQFEFDRYNKDLRDFHAYLSTLQPIPHTFTGPSRIVPDIEWRYEGLKGDRIWITITKEAYEKFPPDQVRRVATPKNK